MRCWMSFLALSIALVGVPAFAAEPSAEKQKTKLPAKPMVRVTIAKDTTYITEPLRKDGYPDYVAALNQRMSKGVTPENNAAVLFWRAMGPSLIYEKYREKHFQMLGAPLPPENGDYFVDYEKYSARYKSATNPEKPQSDATVGNDVFKQLEPAMKHPWSKQEYPVLAEWLGANEKPLALVTEASKRPRWYDPMVAGEKTPLIGVCQPAISAYSRTGNVADALIARAMLRLDEGKPNEAWEDLLTCYRLARLFAQGSTIVEDVDARGINERAWSGNQALLQSTKLTSAMITKMRNDFDNLPPMSKIADVINITERFTYLDDILFTAKDTRASPAAIANTLSAVDKIDGDVRERNPLKLILESAGDTEIDWNIPLRMGNARFDQFVNAMRKPAGVERKEAVEIIDQSAATPRAAIDKQASERSLPDNTREARSRRLGRAFMEEFSTGLTTTLKLYDHATMRLDLTQLAFALAVYRAENGSYPAKLADLAPKYVKQVPKDIFNNDTDLHYTRTGNGYLLYSVGANGKDEGGKSFDDRKAGEDWDDLFVRMSGK